MAGACVFDPPLPGVPAARDAGSPVDAAEEIADAPVAGEDAASPEDAGVATPADAATTPRDATAPADAAASDAAPDAGRTDAASPDAAPTDAARADAAPADGAAPGDTGPRPDAGAFDGGFPAGCPPFPLPPQPALGGAVVVPHGIDRPVLIADLDGDGQEEIVVASARESALSVIDFEGCGMPVVRTRSGISIAGDGPSALPRAGRGALLAIAGGTSLALWRYSSTTAPALAEVARHPAFLPVEFLAGDPEGRLTVATGTWMSGRPGYAGVLPSTLLLAVTATPRLLTGRPAFFSRPESGPPYFAAVDDTAPRVLRPGASDWLLSDGQNVVPSTDPVVAISGAGEEDDRTIVYGAVRDGSAPVLRTTRVSATDPGDMALWGATLMAPMVGAPILLQREVAIGGLRTRVYYAVATGVLQGCELVTGFQGEAYCEPSPLGSPIETLTVPVNQLSSRVGMLTAYVNDNAFPDLIVPFSQSGSIQFPSSRLSMAAAPPVDLGLPVAATPAASVRFFDRYQVGGTLLVVPHPDGRVSFLSWARHPNAGPPERLWLQHRRDMTRSGSL